MEVPQAMLLDWAAKLINCGLRPSLAEVKKVALAIEFYATSNPAERGQLQRHFFNTPPEPRRMQAPNEHAIISADRPVEYGTLDGNTIKVR